MSPSLRAITTLALAGAAQATTTWSLKDEYKGAGFFDKFNFYTVSPDPNWSYVQYRNQSDAKTLGLIGQTGEDVFIRADHTNKGDAIGRNSIRLESKETYTRALIIARFSKLPKPVCGSWPAFWTYGEPWPNVGEIDIMETWNDGTVSNSVMHTGDSSVYGNCKLESTGIRGGAGSVTTSNCDNLYADYVTQWPNQGCSVKDTDGPYGTASRAGTYAVEWTSEAIKVYSFKAGSEPANIGSSNPDTSSWGLPTMRVSNANCNIDRHFADQKIVLNMAFCGIPVQENEFWINQSQCNTKTNYATCVDYVKNEPQDFADVSFQIKDIRVFTQTTVASTTTSSTSTSSTSTSSTSTTETSTEVTDEPTATETTAEPTATDGTEEPTATDGTEEPTATDGTNEPTATDGTEEPTATDGTEEPTATDGTEEPTATDGTEEPTATDGTEEPTATDGTEEPTATDGTEEPTATDGTEEPTATDGTEEPTATDGTEEPTATDGTEEPTATDGTEEPTCTDDTEEPTETDDGLVTSTVSTTIVETVTACPETVTNCPIGAVVTRTVAAYTTVCPAEDITSAPVTTLETISRDRKTTITSHITTIRTVTLCPPIATDCTPGDVVTEVVATSSVCDDDEVPAVTATPEPSNPVGKTNTTSPVAPCNGDDCSNPVVISGAFKASMSVGLAALVAFFAL